MVPPQLVVDYYFFPGRGVSRSERKDRGRKGIKKDTFPRKHSPRTRLQKKTNNAQSEVHARFDAQRVVHQRQGLEPSHEPPRVAAVVAHGEELPPADVTEEALQSQVAVCGQGEAVDGVGERAEKGEASEREGRRKRGRRGEGPSSSARGVAEKALFCSLTLFFLLQHCAALLFLSVLRVTSVSTRHSARFRSERKAEGNVGEAGSSPIER